ncbi:MAG: chemotaxis protein CheX [Verrucomicrobiota bacterium]
MKPADMQLFVDISVNFFTKLTGEPPLIADGQLQFGLSPLLDFTGMIHISGASAGVVGLSLSSSMAMALLTGSGESRFDEAACDDFVGEAASIIASNARMVFGSSFGISIPQRSRRSSVSTEWPYSRLALPIRWRSHEAVLFLALSEASDPVPFS